MNESKMYVSVLQIYIYCIEYTFIVCLVYEFDSISPMFGKMCYAYFVA
jgi:hypothetical protein